MWRRYVYCSQVFTTSNPSLPAIPSTSLSQGMRTGGLYSQYLQCWCYLRTADGCHFEHIHLCGITPTLENKRVGKTALGAENTVPWSFHPNSINTAEDLPKDGWLLCGLENSPHANSIFSSTSEKKGAPIALIIGNEIAGVDPHLIALCDRILTILMLGYRKSGLA
jgi:23S rRNA (guanosine2251-2'-O)-methyltransferase